MADLCPHCVVYWSSKVSCVCGAAYNDSVKEVNRTAVVDGSFVAADP